MARKITDFNAYTPVSSAYPYADLKDDSGAGDGTNVERLSSSDIWQFFQKMSAQAGLTLNSLADNATNGWQFVEAFNTIISEQASVLATAAGASGFTPVVLTGMAQSSSIGFSIASGWFFYNSTLYYCNAGTLGSISAGNEPYLALSSDNGFNIATLVQMVNTTPNDADYVYVGELLKNQIQIPTIQTTMGLTAATSLTPTITTTFNHYGIKELFYTATAGSGVQIYATIDATDAIMGAKVRIILDPDGIASELAIQTTGSIIVLGTFDQTSVPINSLAIMELEYIGDNGTYQVFTCGVSYI